MRRFANRLSLRRRLECGSVLDSHDGQRETAAMTAIGTFLGTLYRVELADRISVGSNRPQITGGWRLNVVSGRSPQSRQGAGAITRTVEDQYQLGMRAVAANIANLRGGVALLRSDAPAPWCGWRRACRWQSDEAEQLHGRPPSGSPSRVASGCCRLGSPLQSWRGRADAHRLSWVESGCGGVAITSI
jgi:hypothetical protein